MGHRVNRCSSEGEECWVVECIETGSLRTGSSGDCARPNLAPSLDIHETAATDKVVHLSWEGAVRWAWGGGYSTSICFEVAKIEEVVRE